MRDDEPHDAEFDRQRVEHDQQREAEHHERIDDRQCDKLLDERPAAKAVARQRVSRGTDTAVAISIVATATTRLVVNAAPIDWALPASDDTNVCQAARYQCRLNSRGGNSSVPEAPNDIVIIVRIGSDASNSTSVASRR